MKVLICGDFIVYGKIKHSLNNIFGDFGDVIKDSDISIYNQEFPLTTNSNIYSTIRHGLTPATDPQVIDRLVNTGFTHATLANNHIFNRGIEGLRDTITNLENKGIKCLGAGYDLIEASKLYYYYNNEYKLAFLNYAENEYATATNYHGGANPLNIINVVKDIQEAKKHAKYIFLIIHGGIDYCRIPSPRMVKMYRFFAEQGVSAIIGHHSHVVSGFETYKQVPIFYGIGNFIPGKVVTKDCLYSTPVQFQLSEDNNLKFKIFPLFFNKNENCIEQIKGKDLIHFQQDQDYISRLLENMENLKVNLYQNYLTKEREAYYFTLFTRSNYFLFKVFRKIGMISIYHKYISKKMKLNKKNSALWNLFRCETHNDVLDLIYEKYIDTYKNDNPQ